MVQAQLIGAASSRLRALDVRIEGSDLSGSDFDESSFTRVVFHECRLSGAVFSRCSFRDVLFSGCRLNQTNFAMSETSNVMFEDSDLRESDFYAANLGGTRFFDCNLSGAQFSKATTTGPQGSTGPGRCGHRVVPGAPGGPGAPGRSRHRRRRRARSSCPGRRWQGSARARALGRLTRSHRRAHTRPAQSRECNTQKAIGGLLCARWCGPRKSLHENGASDDDHLSDPPRHRDRLRPR
jgi:hypothetical protein